MTSSWCQEHNFYGALAGVLCKLIAYVHLINHAFFAIPIKLSHLAGIGTPEHFNETLENQMGGRGPQTESLLKFCSKLL